VHQFGLPLVQVPDVGNSLLSVAFSHDGTRVVTASIDHSVRVLSAEGTREPLVLTGHTDLVRSASFSPDDSRVVTASDDGTACIWRVTWDSLIKYLRASIHA
jgi:WD40 repeat protein